MSLVKDEGTPLNAEQLQAMSNVPIKFVVYDELGDTTLYQLLENNAVCILLKIHGDGNIAPVGHWVALIKNKAGIEHFDSYGLTLDKELSITHENKHLSDMLKNVHFTESKFKFQEFRHEVNTCGRHCVVRCMMKHMTTLEYTKWMRGMPAKADEVVTMMTMFPNKS